MPVLDRAFRSLPPTGSGMLREESCEVIPGIPNQQAELGK